MTKVEREFRKAYRSGGKETRKCRAMAPDRRYGYDLLGDKNAVRLNYKSKSGYWMRRIVLLAEIGDARSPRHALAVHWRLLRSRLQQRTVFLATGEAEPIEGTAPAPIE